MPNSVVAVINIQACHTPWQHFFPHWLIALHVQKNTFFPFLTFEVLYSSWGSTKRLVVSSFVETMLSTCEMYMLTSFNAARYASRSARSCENMKTFSTKYNIDSWRSGIPETRAEMWRPLGKRQTKELVCFQLYNTVLSLLKIIPNLSLQNSKETLTVKVKHFL